MSKYLVSENCCEINHEAAQRKKHDMSTTKTLFECLGGCLVVDEANEKWLTEEQRAMLVDELPEEYQEPAQDPEVDELLYNEGLI